MAGGLSVLKRPSDALYRKRENSLKILEQKWRRELKQSTEEHRRVERQVEDTRRTLHNIGDCPNYNIGGCNDYNIGGCHHFS